MITKSAVPFCPVVEMGVYGRPTFCPPTVALIERHDAVVKPSVCSVLGNVNRTSDVSCESFFVIKTVKSRNSDFDSATLGESEEAAALHSARVRLTAASVAAEQLATHRSNRDIFIFE